MANKKNKQYWAIKSRKKKERVLLGETKSAGRRIREAKTMAAYEKEAADRGIPVSRVIAEHLTSGEVKPRPLEKPPGSIAAEQYQKSRPSEPPKKGDAKQNK